MIGERRHKKVLASIFQYAFAELICRYHLNCLAWYARNSFGPDIVVFTDIFKWKLCPRWI